MYYVFKVTRSTAPLYNNMPTKLIGICKTKANSSAQAVAKVRKSFNISNEVILLAHQNNK
tara:strand:+ start:125 stop:304 length:180 start_codon:yes stop_codon:yes gene_type:complete